MIAVAGIGIVVNGFTAWLFMRGSKHDLNLRGAYLHMAADAAVSVGVVVAGVAIGLTGLLWIDPAIRLVIAAVIVRGTWGLLRAMVTLSLAAGPSGIDHGSVDGLLDSHPGVYRVPDHHILAMSTNITPLTA